MTREHDLLAGSNWVIPWILGVLLLSGETPASQATPPTEATQQESKPAKTPDDPAADPAMSIEELTRANAEAEKNDASTNHVRESLLAAVRSGDLNAARELLGSGADPNSLDQKERTPLFIAASGSKEADTKMVALLLEHGADPNAV